MIGLLIYFKINFDKELLFEKFAKKGLKTNICNIVTLKNHLLLFV